LRGAWVGRESKRSDGEDGPWVAVAGGMVAASVSIAAPIVRMAASKVLGVPDALLGLGEDYLGLQYGTQAMDLPMDEITGAACEVFEDVRKRAEPALESMGIGS